MSAFRRSAGRGTRRSIIGLAVIAAMMCVLIGPAVGTAAAEPPVNSGFVEVTGEARLGEELTCHVGSWSGAAPQFAFVWLRDGIPVGTNSVYKVETADEGNSLSCRVTVTEGTESVEEESINSVEIPGGSKGEPPKDITLPHIAGTAAVGQKLKCEEGKWSGKPAPGFAYEWLRNGSIELKAGQEYEVVPADEGNSLSCRVTASNSEGKASATSEQLQIKPAKAPKDITAPKVLGGAEPTVGHELTCNPGTWEGEPTFTYQWLRDGGRIGAEGQTYIIATSDETHNISCEVTASNGVEPRGKALSENSVHVAGSAPKDNTPPTIAGAKEGQAKEGQELKCERGVWSGAPEPSFKYVWVRDRGLQGQQTFDPEQKTYTVAAGDKGHTLSCEVTASNEVGSLTVASESVIVASGNAGEPTNVEPPQVAPSTSTPSINETLTCSSGSWIGHPTITYTYQWVLEPGSPSETTLTSGEERYTIVSADAGHTLACKVTAKNGEGVAIARSRTLTVVGIAPKNTELPKLSGKAEVNETLSCSLGKWTGQPEPTYTYEWVRDKGLPDEASIASATTSSYVVKSEDRGYTLSCLVKATNGTGPPVEADSSNSLHILGSPPVNSGEAVVMGTLAVGHRLKCEPGNWSGAPTPKLEYRWLLNGTLIPAAIQAQYTVVEADEGRVVACEVVASNVEGTVATVSEGVRVPGTKPESTGSPQIKGNGGVGESLTCEPGDWNGKPPPTFKFEWLRDGSTIVSPTASDAYTVVAADEGHSLSCKVIATSSEGTAAAASAGIEIYAAQTKVEASRETKLVPSLGGDPAATATAAQILTSLSDELTRAQHTARISSLLKAGVYDFGFTALGAGTLSIFWYEVPKGAHVSSAKSKPKPVLVALATVSFASATEKTAAMRLTKAGRSLLKHSKSIKLTAKGVFTPAGGHAVTWLKTFVLSH